MTKTNNKIYGTCRICGTPITTKNKIASHAISRSIYSDKMELKHGEHLLMLTKQSGTTVEADYGHFQTETGILCKDCDYSLSKYEDERANFMRDNENIAFESSHKIVPNYNPANIKIAFLADIFRCSCFSLECCKDINIGQKHTDKIAKLLRTKSPGECDDYSIWIFKMTDNDNLMNGAGMYPHRCKFNGLNCYRALYPGGWEWIIKMDSRKNDYDKASSFFGKDIVLLNGKNFKESGLFRDILEIV